MTRGGEVNWLVINKRTIAERHATLAEERYAVFDLARLYRYFLSIVWDATLPILVAVMLNPSTADHLKNDPTVERVCRRGRRMGMGGVIILNAFAWRETKRLLMLKTEDPVGPMNDSYIMEVLLQAASQPGWVVMVGWGIEGGHNGRSARMARLLTMAGVEACCLKYLGNGEPGHPLYIGYDVELKPWPRVLA